MSLDSIAGPTVCLAVFEDVTETENRFLDSHTLALVNRDTPSCTPANRKENISVGIMSYLSVAVDSKYEKTVELHGETKCSYQDREAAVCAVP